MADDKLFENLSTAIEGKAAELASAKDSAAVTTILTEAKNEALSNTPIFTSDIYIYRVTVTVLGIAVLAGLAAQYGLTMGGHTIPDGIIAIGAAAIGALAGLLAPTPSR